MIKNIFKICGNFIILIFLFFFSVPCFAIIQLDRFKDGFNLPSAVENDNDGNVIIADTGNNKIIKMNNNLNELFSISGSVNGQTLNYPQGVTVDINNNIYIADTGNHRILKYTSAGIFISSFGSGLGTSDTAFFNPRDLKIYQENLFVLDSGNHRITAWNFSGAFIRKITFDQGTEDDQLNNPYSFDIDDSGMIYIANTYNNNIAVLDNSGIFQYSLTPSSEKEGNIDLLFPKGIAVKDYRNLLLQRQGLKSGFGS